jgi:SAM-dependent methyltransferase
VSPEIRHLLSLSIGIATVIYLLGQCRKPKGWLGRFVLWSMNSNHSNVTDWGLTHAAIERHFTILDVGCGGGRTVQKLATRAREGRVCGIDYSPASVATSSRTNAEWIQSGRVEIRQASVSRLPFPDGTFDLVTAVETHYYWPDLVADLREVRRVLKRGGRLLLIAEAYRGQRFDAVFRVVMPLLRGAYLSADEHRETIRAAGYSNVEVFEDRGKGWLCAVAGSPTVPGEASTGAPRGTTGA